MPAYGKDKPLPTPHIAKKTLANGLQVWVVPRNGVPRVDMVLAVRGAGYVADDAAHPGFANMMAGLLNEGTAKHDSRAIAELAQGLGGSVGGGATADGITVSANALASQAGPMLQLLAEVARTPSFPAKEVALAKANALQACACPRPSRASAPTAPSTAPCSATTLTATPRRPSTPSTRSTKRCCTPNTPSASVPTRRCW
jgi:zinc protease